MKIVNTLVADDIRDEAHVELRTTFGHSTEKLPRLVTGRPNSRLVYCTRGMKTLSEALPLGPFAVGISRSIF